MWTPVNRESSVLYSVLGVTVCWVSFVAGGRAEAQPALIQLGVLPGSDSSVANAVSADGSHVAGTVSTSGQTYRGFTWTQNTGMIELAVLPGYVVSEAYGISSDGSVVAGRCHSGTNGQSRACTWANAGPATNLGTYNNGSVSWAYAISGDGVHAAGYASSGSSLYSIRWNGNILQFLGGLPSSTSNYQSIALAINEDGSVVVGHSPTTSTVVAYRWTAVGGFENLGVLAGFDSSDANGVSADGTVVVGACTANSGMSRAFRWTRSLGMQSLGTNPTARALAASGDGSIIVGYGGGTAIVWTAQTGIVNLSAYLAAHGVNSTGWVFSAAYAISKDGTTIVGLGGSSGFPTRGFVARGLSGCKPVISSQPTDSQTCASEAITLSVQASSGTALSFRWRKNNIPIDSDSNPSAASPTLVLSSVSVQDSGEYDCVLTNGCGSVETQPAMLVVRSASHPACGGPTCDADVNRDGALDQGDVDYLINVIAGGGNPEQSNPDFNTDGAADQGDIDALINVVAGGPCP
ncbi:MAG: hypothetical protein GC200_10560 [Tepidisphaera sp.]|nr:hypothetical protein [Tepidisphaera sp.]